MLILPAIDLMGGNAVRLYKGKRDSAKIYSNAPAEIALGFVRAGAKRVHVVDLDAAFGDGDNRAVLSAIAATGAEVQAGGGVRDLAAARALLDAGCRAIVLGTSAVKQPELVESLCRELPGRVVVAVDAHGDKVAVEGWAEKTDVDAADLAARAVEWGAAAILYTDIARDGTGVGPNVEATARLARVLHPTPVIASGGIGSLDHLRALALAGVPQAVVGRALYEHKFTLGEAFEAAGHA
ncbi:MAG TPA: 1-(5-phosphoribosyl)-5-[(5-phosphoribosylamino)methylideneamino]imidazole-4-carboxamide isomerase [Polyangia bacterium]